MTLRIASVCKTLPSPDSTASGAFVMRRLEAMAMFADLEVFQPIPYCPALRPLPRWAMDESHQVGQQLVQHAPMFYLPGVLKRWDGRFLQRAVSRRLDTIARPRAFDLIDAHFGYPDGVGAVRAAVKLGLPAFVTIRGLETDYLRDASIRPQLLRALNTALGCISVSHSLKTLVTHHGVPPDRVEVIPNAVDRSIFKPGDKLAARVRLGLVGDQRLILSVGTLIDLKRHHVVLRAMPDLRKRLPGARLAIVGMERDEPGYLPQLRRLAEELGLADAVQFVGAVQPGEVAHWLAASDAFCLVSAREGCCNAVLEALACGRPVVATPVGDNTQYVADGVNGRIVPVDDSTATSQALADVLSDQHWDAERISRGLPVGEWGHVGRRVIEFFSERLASRADTSTRRAPATP